MFLLGLHYTGLNYPGGLVKWVVELSEFDLWNLPYLSLKVQVLEDFIIEWLDSEDRSDQKTMEWWILYVDGASHGVEMGIRLVLQSLTGEHLEQTVWLGFHTSNNEAEYDAIFVGISLELSIQASHLDIQSDSQLVVNQVQGEYKARDVRMVRYL